MINIDLGKRPKGRDRLATWYAAALAQQVKSGLSVAAFATELGVTPATLYQWKRRLSSAAEPQKASEELPGLVRVRVRESEAQLTGGPNALVVRLGRGRAIEVPLGFDADDVARLIAVVVAC